MNQIPPRKVVAPFGRSERTPVKAVATTPRYNTAPRKTVVGSTAQPPRKDVVGSTAAPRPKVIVGSTAAPPRKTTPANLGTGGKNPLGMTAADRGAINAGNPSTVAGGSANPGRSVNGLGPIVGPPNPTLTWEKPLGVSGIVAGGMGPTAKRIGVKPRTKLVPRRNPLYGE